MSQPDSVDRDLEALHDARRLGAELSLVASSLLAVDPARTAVVVEQLIEQALSAARAAGLAHLHEVVAADVDAPPTARRCVLAGLMVSLALGRPTTNDASQVLLGA
jgi:hypothetical protein